MLGVCVREIELRNLPIAGTRFHTRCTHQVLIPVQNHSWPLDTGSNSKTSSRKILKQLYFRFRSWKSNGKLFTSFFPVLQSYIIALLTFEHYSVRLLSPPQESFLCILTISSNAGRPESSSELAEISNQEIPI